MNDKMQQILHKVNNNSRNTFSRFDKIYCVHLDRDSQRKQQMSNEFNKLGILDRITWLSATPPTPAFTSNNFQVAGELGCTLSHLKIIIDALNSNIEFGIVVFEDDASFFDTSHVSEALNELPNDWDVLYFGGNPYEPMSDFSPNLVTVGKFLTTVGYAISKKALTSLALYTIDCIGQPYPEAVADIILDSFSQKHTSLCVYPPIVTQRPGISTLRKMHRDYTSLIQQNWKKFKPAARV